MPHRQLAAGEAVTRLPTLRSGRDRDLGVGLAPIAMAVEAGKKAETALVLQIRHGLLVRTSYFHWLRRDGGGHGDWLNAWRNIFRRDLGGQWRAGAVSVTARCGRRVRQDGGQKLQGAEALWHYAGDAVREVGGAG